MPRPQRSRQLCWHAKLPRNTEIIVVLSWRRMDAFRAKQQRIPSLSWRRDDRFSAQNGKDEPNPRTARAWQEKTIKKRNVNKSRYDMLIDRLARGLPSIGHCLYIGRRSLRTEQDLAWRRRDRFPEVKPNRNLDSVTTYTYLPSKSSCTCST
jgi:hypothetical protein